MRFANTSSQGQTSVFVSKAPVPLMSIVHTALHYHLMTVLTVSVPVPASVFAIVYIKP